jgi:hypothetical protein
MFSRLVRLVLCLLLLQSSGGTLVANEASIQAQLDQACQAARERRLVPLRKKYIRECIEIEGKDSAYCKRFYRDYGERAGNRPALFNDLPACIKAYEYQKRGYRHTD